MTVSVGIDIAAKTVDCAVWRDGAPTSLGTFEQTPTGHAALTKKLVALAPEHVVMEATGVYYLDLAVALADADLPVSVINPRSFRHFAALKLQGSKTDALDSALLAEYGARMTPGRWSPPSAARLALRDLARQLNRLSHARTQAKNRLHALRAKAMTLPLLIEDEQAGIDELERRIQRLVAAAKELINEEPALAASFQHLQAAKGVGEATALAILGELEVLPDCLRAPQVVRYAGLDVRHTESGTSVSRPGRLSKAGNVYLRSALYMPALTAVRYDPVVKAFYESLLARGKRKLQALCAVMRKYLMGLWACLKTQQPFDSRLLFASVPGENG